MINDPNGINRNWAATGLAVRLAQMVFSRDPGSQKLTSLQSKAGLRELYYTLDIIASVINYLRRSR
jgi:hypothetical protein